jgi:signal transduction histidine kinase
LSVKNFDVISDFKTKIEPYPLFKLYDYKISGIIDKTGDGILNYSMQRARNTVAEQIPFSYGKPTKCGKVVFDIRVFDREADSIDQLIKRGLKDDGGNYVGKLEARHLLDEYNGIGVYRNGFRIRPLGDADFDWLKLNEKRIQNPSRKIGSNQVIGIVKIENEESSGLIEKSARDGLKENQAYIDLADLTEEVIIKLETRRFDYRKKAGLSRSALKIESEFEKLFSFDSLKKNVRRSLAKGNVNKNISDDVLKVIDDSEKEKNQLANSIREAVAVYQGQATLGKIINVILHEGRKPLNFFKNQIPILDFYYDEYRHGNSENFPAIFETLKNMSSNSDVLIKLFEKIDPLATGRRGKRKKINLLKEIKSIFSIFDIELKDVKVSATTDNGKDVFFTCWRQDIYSIFTNLIENSIYWLNVKECRNKQIYIIINCTDDNIEFIDYRDTGPGIEPSLIESGIIFEPEFSTKPEGTGLGLSIAGEAAKRCGFSLEALSSDTGAYFRLQRIGGNE